jgi:hypothetical protein
MLARIARRVPVMASRRVVGRQLGIAVFDIDFDAGRLRDG